MSYPIIHIRSREESDYSNAAESYSEWQYGEEASLYSIAEDSREERESEITLPNDTCPSPSITEHDGECEVPTADRSFDKIIMVAGLDRQFDDGLTSKPTRSDGSLGETYFVYHNSRRVFMIGAALVISLILIAVVAVVVLMQGHSSGSSSTPNEIINPFTPAPQRVQTFAPSGAMPTARPVFRPPPTAAPMSIVQTSSPVRPITSAPTKSPLKAATASPTLRPTSSNPTISAGSIAFVLAQQTVTKALSQCPGSSSLSNSSTLQGQIYNRLVYDYNSTATFDGSLIFFPSDDGDGYLRDRYALEMLYQTSNGSQWKQRNKWNSNSDPCSGWYGVLNCPKRVEDECAVLYLSLNSNQLQGYIPEEICCLKCLQGLFLAGNELSGTIPQCLLDRNITLSLEGNNLDANVQG